MNEWISVKSALPLNDSFVMVKIFVLWKSEKDAFFSNKYFVHKGENISKWVTHWMPLLEQPK